jgi:hypothetical protein
MLELLRPGGAALLVSDLVSSLTLPELAESPAPDLKTAMLRALEERNFFSGANPFVLLAELRDSPELAGLVGQAVMAEPWVWRQTGERSYLVYALALSRKGPAG